MYRPLQSFSDQRNAQRAVRRFASANPLQPTAVLLAAIGLCGSAFGQPALQVSQSSSRLGSLITVQVVPPTPGFEFDDATTEMVWFGTYTEPGGGSTTSEFSVAYGASDVYVVNDWTAEVVLGAGVFDSAPDLETLTGLGSFGGTIASSTCPECLADLDSNCILDLQDLVTFVNAFSAGDPVGDINNDGTFDLSDIAAFVGAFLAGCQPVNLVGSAGSISVLENPLAWRAIDADPGGITGGPGEIGDVRQVLDAFPLSEKPNRDNPNDQQFLAARSIYNTITIAYEENARTLSGGPQAVLVDIVSLDSSGQEIDRVNTQLTPVSQLAPGSIYYASDPGLPIIFTDYPVTPGALTSVVAIFAEDGGTILAVPTSTIP